LGVGGALLFIYYGFFSHNQKVRTIIGISILVLGAIGILVYIFSPIFKALVKKTIKEYDRSFEDCKK
jgi:hypothetical protein